MSAARRLHSQCLSEEWTCGGRPKTRILYSAWLGGSGSGNLVDAGDGEWVNTLAGCFFFWIVP